MAYSSGAVAAGETSALQADKPFLLSHNAIETFNAAPQWRTSGSWTSGSDDVATGFPTSRVYDRRFNLVTKPTNAATTHYLIFDLTETGTTASLPIDTIVIGGHNFGSLTTPTISAEISNNSDFSVSVAMMPATSITNSKRIVWWDLGSAASFTTYYNVRYVRIKIALGASQIPQIGEIIMGKRHQLGHRPNEPYDDKPLGADVTDFASKAGNRSRYVRHAGRAVFNCEWLVSSSDAYSIDGTTQIRNWWKYTNYGAKPFLYCDAPTANQVSARYTNRAHWCYVEDALLSMASTGPSAFNTSFVFAEDAPFVETET